MIFNSCNEILNRYFDISRRPIEEILKLLPGPHSDTKRVSTFLTDLFLLFCFSCSYSTPDCSELILLNCHRGDSQVLHHLIIYRVLPALLEISKSLLSITFRVLQNYFRIAMSNVLPIRKSCLNLNLQLVNVKV